MLARQMQLPSAVAGRGEPVASHDDHRTAGMLHAMRAHRTHQHASEATVTMATSDEQVGVGSRGEQHRRGWPSMTEVPRVCPQSRPTLL
jgi:hypothetical protein